MADDIPPNKIPMINEALVTHVIQQHYSQVKAISLFGSYAQGTPWPQSDVDLAVLLPAHAKHRLWHSHLAYPSYQ